MASSHVEQIKEKLSIVDVISSYIPIEKAGVNFKAKCPFHNEKSPSFFVSPVRNSYYCFGCGAKGDIISFVEQFEGLDFIGALRILAKRAGVELTRENPTLRTERERLYLTMEHATLFFQRQLASNQKALEYIKKRGLTEETIKSWRVGFSSVEWRTLHAYLLGRKIPVTDMEKVGLVKKSEKSHGDVYDRFRGRIMFPIFDSSGRVVAFSGRQFESDGTEAKYLNSPETVLFEKSKILYGYDKAKLNIRKEDFALLVEGQMDLLMAHQAGFTNTVASSGTALTKEHLEILRRLSNNLIIAYDGDSAGATAAKRGWQIALSLGMEVKIASLPDKNDPADLILKDSKLFAEAVKNARHIIDVELERILAKKLPDRELKVMTEKELLPYIASIGGLAQQSHFIREIALATKMKEDLIWQIVKKMQSPIQTQTQSGYQSPLEKPSADRKYSISRLLAGILLWNKDLDIRVKICTIVGEDVVKEFEQAFKDVRDDLIFEAETAFAQSDKLGKHVEELAHNLKEELVREEFADVMFKLQNAEREKNAPESERLLKRCQELSLQLREITQRIKF